MPCSTRAAMSTSTLGATAHRSEATVNHDRADHEDAPPAQAVTERAAEEDQRSEAQRVPLRTHCSRRSWRRGPRRCGGGEVDDGRVEHRHPRAEHRGGSTHHPRGLSRRSESLGALSTWLICLPAAARDQSKAARSGTAIAAVSRTRTYLALAVHGRRRRKRRRRRGRTRRRRRRERRRARPARRSVARPDARARSPAHRRRRRRDGSARGSRCRRVHDVGTDGGVRLQPVDRVVEIVDAADVVLGPRREHQPDRSGVGGVGGSGDAVASQVTVVDRPLVGSPILDRAPGEPDAAADATVAATSSGLVA